MMNAEQRQRALERMELASSVFYGTAVRIGNHPFIEFTGLMNEYIKACLDAHVRGIDFSECNAHSGQQLPLKTHELLYIQEKLDCIFGGRLVIKQT